MTQHLPVMVNEVIRGLAIRPDGTYIDATFGRGGHSRTILDNLGETGRLVALDRDPEAVAFAAQAFGDDDRFEMVATPFGQLKAIADKLAINQKVDGLLIDLGVSSPQLDNEGRGFSFSRTGPLDMRMDPTQGMSAAEWIMTASTEEMVKIFYDFGEERFAKQIASAISSRREQEQISTTTQLAEIIATAKPVWEKHIHPATKVFQAIRIHINKELEELQAVLSQSLEVLAVGGRIVVISFHSLEDRIVKRFLRQQSRDQIPNKIPIQNAFLTPPMRVVGKGQKATAEEVANNPRSRSAVLRIGEKLA